MPRFKSTLLFFIYLVKINGSSNCEIVPTFSFPDQIKIMLIVAGPWKKCKSRNALQELTTSETTIRREREIIRRELANVISDNEIVKKICSKLHINKYCKVNIRQSGFLRVWACKCFFWTLQQTKQSTVFALYMYCKNALNPGSSKQNSNQVIN